MTFCGKKMGREPKKIFGEKTIFGFKIYIQSKFQVVKITASLLT